MNQEKDALYATPLNAEWQKASFSNGSGENCVQLMGISGGVAIGDSKRPDRPELRYTPSEFAAFIQGVKAGEFDHLLND
ncbi:DUF397 domain-containing protein [Streptomyces sp. NPDC005970]|uniref:DUF397 domain-containing protein n=1 Tax=Streptomyces sp. NPDC005970 TaxID=3156723 RepID=UPI0033FB921C